MNASSHAFARIGNAFEKTREGFGFDSDAELGGFLRNRQLERARVEPFLTQDRMQAFPVHRRVLSA